jgi:hypothetical protein
LNWIEIIPGPHKSAARFIFRWNWLKKTFRHFYLLWEARLLFQISKSLVWGALKWLKRHWKLTFQLCSPYKALSVVRKQRHVTDGLYFPHVKYGKYCTFFIAYFHVLGLFMAYKHILDEKKNPSVTPKVPMRFWTNFVLMLSRIKC